MTRGGVAGPDSVPEAGISTGFDVVVFSVQRQGMLVDPALRLGAQVEAMIRTKCTYYQLKLVCELLPFLDKRDFPKKN